MKRRTEDRKHGFSAVEFLLASALFALLLSALLAVIGDLARLPEIAPRAEPASLESILRLVRSDVESAEGIHYAPGVITLLGHRAIDAGRVDHRAVLLRYEIESAGNHPFFLRRERRLGLLTNDDLSAELVSGGIERFELLPGCGPGDEGEGGALQYRGRLRRANAGPVEGPPPPFRGQLPRLQPVPDCLTLRLWIVGSPGRLFERRIQLR